VASHDRLQPPRRHLVGSMKKIDEKNAAAYRRRERPASKPERRRTT
jgi:hypothetical protein